MATTFQPKIARSDVVFPTEVSNEILQDVPRQSAVLSLFRRLPNMSRQQYTVRVLDALPKAEFLNADNYDPEVTSDINKKPLSKQKWIGKIIHAEPLAVIVPIPEDVLSDADYDIWGEVRPRIAEAFGAAIDGAVLFGNGAPGVWPTSLAAQAIVAGNNVAYNPTAGTDFADIADYISKPDGLMSLVEEDGYEVTGFASATRVRAMLRGLRDDNGQFIFQPSMRDSEPNRIFGLPGYFANTDAWDADTALMFAGKWSEAVYSIRADISYKVLTEATLTNSDGETLNLAQQDAVALRAVMRLGWQVPNPVNRKNQTRATRFPFAVLQPGEGS
jgi:HK97 family phage major capsid protein